MIALGASLWGQSKPKKATKEPPTQTLPALQDPPAAVAAETARLTFHVSGLSNKGLLSQQTRDALKSLFQLSHGGRVVKLRAFVAGTGDARRVQAIVSEVFTDRKQPLPAVSTIQVGSLPLEGAQVVIESVSEEKDKKAVNPAGLAFFAAQHGADAKESLERLSAIAQNVHVAPADMLRVTCFLSSEEDAPAAQAEAARAFPAAAADVVQRLRVTSGSATDCEGAGRLKAAGGQAAIQVTSDAALVSAPKVIFSGSQMAFRDQDADLRLAFARLKKALELLGATTQDVILSNLYPVSRAVEAKLPALRMEFFRNPSPATMLIFEGLPSPDASMSVEVMAALK